MTTHLSSTYLANGCFWCTEEIFNSLSGVVEVTPGYTGGSVPNPTYEQVCTGTTGHAEALCVKYDQSLISYEDLLKVFFGTHDPTTLNKQGNDVGTQYRSAIFYQTDEEKRMAEKVIQELEEQSVFNEPIVTEVAPFNTFYEAEDYHHNYYEHNPNAPYCMLVISPKLEKFRQQYSELLKS